MPYKTALGVTYDCGEFEKNMDTALRLADVAGFAARRRGVEGARPAARPGDRQRHRAGGRPAAARVRRDPVHAERHARPLFMGTKNQGQGHETTFKQILHERLGLDPADVRYIDGDTDRVAFGMGTIGLALDGDRAAPRSGWRPTRSSPRASKIAAHLLEAAEADIELRRRASSRWWAPTDALAEGGRAAAFQPAQLPAGLRAAASTRTRTFSPEQDTYPNGCHVCEVEVDPETGDVDARCATRSSTTSAP